MAILRLGKPRARKPLKLRLYNLIEHAHRMRDRPYFIHGYDDVLGSVKEGTSDLILFSSQKTMRLALVYIAKKARAKRIPFIYIKPRRFAELFGEPADQFMTCAVVSDWHNTLPDKKALMAELWSKIEPSVMNPAP